MGRWVAVESGAQNATPSMLPPRSMDPPHYACHWCHRCPGSIGLGCLYPTFSPHPMARLPDSQGSGARNREPLAHRMFDTVVDDHIVITKGQPGAQGDKVPILQRTWAPPCRANKEHISKNLLETPGIKNVSQLLPCSSPSSVLGQIL